MAVPGRYSVSYLLLGQGTTVVADIGSATDAARILAALDWLGRPLAEARAVVPTHLHFDHIVGIEPFSRRYGVPVGLGEVAWEVVRRGRKLRWPPPLPLLRASLTYPMAGAPPPARGDLPGGLDFGFVWSRNRFSDVVEEPLRDGAELPWLPGWAVLATPGHADDAIALYHEEAGFLVTGDTVRNFLGGEWNPLLADPEAYERTRQRLLGLHVEAIFPGHGPVLEGPDVVRRLRRYPFFVP